MTRPALLFTLLTLLTAALFIGDLAVGSVDIPLGKVWAALSGGECDPALRTIILKIRLLKAVTALLAGAALAASGLEMQTLFRNPLAGPYVLGVSSGASLGVALFLLGAPLLGIAGHSFVQSLGIIGAAWLGSALVLAVVMAVMMLMFGWGVPAAVVLYYVTSSLWQVVQQKVITQRVMEKAKAEAEAEAANKPVEVDVVRREKKPRPHKKN